MRLHLKHFKSQRCVDLCDDYDNVLKHFTYDNERMDIGATIRINAYVAGFTEGWEKARRSIGAIEGTAHLVDVDAQNERIHGGP